MLGYDSFLNGVNGVEGGRDAVLVHSMESCSFDE